MRLTLKVLAVAAAVTAPAFAGIPTAAAAESLNAVERAAKAGPAATLQLARHSIRPVFKAHGRCLLPRIKLIVRHRNQLRRLGYKPVKYAGYFQVRHLCQQAVFFAACKRGIRYRVDFRYRKGKLVSRSRYAAGRCPRVRILGPNRFKSAS